MPQDDARIQTTIKDPEFLKLSGDDQVAVLKHMRSQTPTPKTPAVTELEKASSSEQGLGGTYKKLGRGFVTGAASGAGIPESTSPGEVVGGALKNVGTGLARAGGAVAEDVGSVFTDPFLPKEKRLTFRNDPVIRIADEMGKNLEDTGKEAWQGLKQRDPEAFAHGLGSMVTQLLTLEAGDEGLKGKAASVSERARLAKTVDALNIGKSEIKDVKTAMPEIVKQAQKAGVKTVGDFGKNLKQARTVVDQEFNQGLAKIANKASIPSSISQRIRSLITPDMAKTAEGREDIKYIQKRAREYEKPWTYNELNAKRMTENENLTSYYGKDTRGQAAARLETDVSKAIRDEAANTVYQAWDKANPGGRAQILKQRQGALWALDDYVNHPTKGFLADVDAKQLQFEGAGLGDKVHARAAVHKGGVSAYLTSSLLAPFEQGPKAKANAKIRQAFPEGNKTPFASKAALPIAVLAGRPTPYASSKDEE